MSIRVERRWPLWAVLAVALAWLAAALAGATPPTLATLPALALALLPPLALLLLVTALLPPGRDPLPLVEAETRLENAVATATILAARLGEIDAHLASSTAHVEGLATATAATLPGLGGSAEAISAVAADVARSGADAGAVIDTLAASLPALVATVDTLAMTMARSAADGAAQVASLTAALADAEVRQQAASSAAHADIAAMTAQLGQIDAASQASTSVIAKRAYALDAAVDGVLARSSAALESLRADFAGELDALAGRFAETRDALAGVGNDVGAIEAALAGLANGGEAVSARLATQVAALAERIEAGAARIDAIDARFVTRERDAIGARAARVIERLHEASVDVAHLLGIRLGDSDWVAHRAGDRSVFARAVVPQLGAETDRKMARLFAYDPDFRNEAGFFCDSFDGLIARLASGRDGEAIATTMLTSDIGKIYLALAAASNRNAPQA